MPTPYRRIDGDTVDAVAYRHDGRHGGTTEAIGEANRGLAALPVVLPAGTRLTLPDLDEPRQTVKLYD